MELVKFNEAYHAIMVAKTIDEVKEIRDKAEALRHYLRQQGAGLEMQNACAEIKVRAERRAGELLGEVERSNGGRPENNSLHHATSFQQVLKENDLSPWSAHRFQSIASIPELVFEQTIAETRATDDKELTTTQLLKLSKDLKRQAAQDEITKLASSLVISPNEAYQLIAGDMQTECTELEAESIDVIITDPPYPKEFLPLYGQLAEQAARLLKSGGSLLAMCGQSYLPDIFNLMTPHLAYQWTISYQTPGGQSPQIWARKVNTFWKPILWFVKGEYIGKWHGDVIKSDVNDNDKRYHKWGQSESGTARLVEDYSLPGDLILDPFCGGGTTGLIAVQLKRRFIGIDIDPTQIAITQQRMESSNAS